ncbi:MAG: prolipoprotein diacylglyceryl transferase [Phycisphaerales bacterium]|nr:prolipoprotein diacylglyceryl transferase [Phycisphaerales bacterium]
MYPELFTIPFVDMPVKSYGAMLTLGFLTGVWLCMRRAEHVKADPDIILNVGFVSLLCGVGGGRLFFVLHYWETSFANQPNPIMAALNMTSGGLEYYGGLICAAIGTVTYLAMKRVSVRMYLDILFPGAAWGLAFGRIGCLLNGCCWGGMCVAPNGAATVPWGITFPYGSPAEIRQWENRQTTVPAELIVSIPGRVSQPYLLPRPLIEMPPEERDGLAAEIRQLEREIEEAKALGVAAEKIAELEKEQKGLAEKWKRESQMYGALNYAQKFPSRIDPSRPITVSELEDLTHHHRSELVHPAQIYAVINAFLLSWLLLEIANHRKRHGVVFGTMILIYPITRIILEYVRVDNPHDSAGLTISQAVSVGMFLFGVAYMIYIYKSPLRSPKAVPFVPPPLEDDDAEPA